MKRLKYMFENCIQKCKIVGESLDDNWNHENDVESIRLKKKISDIGIWKPRHKGAKMKVYVILITSYIRHFSRRLNL